MDIIMSAIVLVEKWIKADPMAALMFIVIILALCVAASFPRMLR